MKMSIFALAAVSLVAVVAVQLATENDAQSMDTTRVVPAQSTKAADREPRSRVLNVKTRLLRNDTTINELELMLEAALESGALSTLEVQNVYRKQLHLFDSDTLAKLIEMESPLRLSAMKYIASQSNATLLRDVLANLNDVDAKRSLLQHAGDDSPLFSLDAYRETLDSLPTLEADDFRALGIGLNHRISRTKTSEEKIALIDAYYAQTTEPQVLDRLAKSAVLAMETEEAIEWLTTGSSDFKKLGDQTLLAHLQPNEYAQGTNFINGLIESGDISRARSALTSFIANYSHKSPHEAMEWVTNLDPAVRSSQMVRTAFSNLYLQHPESALEVMKSTDDHELKKIMLSNIEAIDSIPR